MFNLQTGKLLVYASSFTSRESRLRSVSIAAERMAGVLNVDIEVRTFKKKFTPIYVYYKQGDEEPIPIYCNNGEKSNAEDVYATLKNMMFVLSFHPKHSVLRHARKEIMQFS
jgi:roadblock/LC7 domain-containing protein